MSMFHKAIKLTFCEKTSFEVTFSDGAVKRYDVSLLFEKYPQMKALENPKLFHAGKLIGFYGIVWNDELDLEAETVYEDGVTVRYEKLPENFEIGNAVLKARALSGISQSELSEKTGIDQSDISKIERGVANPSVVTLKRIAAALGMQLNISISS